ncbi:MAG TPA: MFS transporter [Candidatus Paceibacterota bacterium]|jgi:MFS family permease
MFRFLFGSHLNVGVRIVTWATAVRWIGWGFVEALIPIFMFSFTDSYAETGLLRSIYSVVFLLAVPFIGMLANRIRARSLILSGAFLYPFIAISYFLAGLWGAVGFIVIARVLNGLSYALDSVGRSTYLRRMSEKEHTGSSFGYMESITNFGWVLAVLASVALVGYFEVHELFLFLVPASVLAIIILFRAPKDSIEAVQGLWHTYLSPRTYANFFQEVLLWNQDLKRLAALLFILTIASASIEYFMPIELFVDGTDIPSIILFVLIFTLPSVFGGAFGWLADRAPRRAITLAFITLGWLLIILGYVSAYWTTLFLVFVIGGLLVFLGVYIDAEMTRRGDTRKYGTLAGGTLEVGEMASLIGPIIIGILIDRYDLGVAFSVLGFIIIMLSVLTRPVHHDLRKKT